MPSSIVARRSPSFVEDLLEVLPVIANDVDVARAHTTLLAAVRRAGRPEARTI
jgi:hypothetical protein